MRPSFCLSSSRPPTRRRGANERALWALAGVMALALPMPIKAASTCQTLSLSDNFAQPQTEDVTHSSVMNWQGGGPIFATHKQGAFAASAAARTTLSERLIAVDANVLALKSGYQNMLVGLSTTGGCKLVAYGIRDSTAAATAPVLDVGVRFVIDANTSCDDGSVVVIGDVAGDSNMDIVTITPKNINTEGSIVQASLYIRNSGRLDFAKTDITALLQAADVRLHGGKPAFLADVNGDGAADLVIGSSHGSVDQLLVFASRGRSGPPGFEPAYVAVPDMGFVGPFADTNASAAFNANTCQGAPTLFVSKGCTSLAYGDLDGDLIGDVVAGSESERGTQVFHGYAQGQFAAQPTVHTFGATIRLEVADIDGDGDLDIAGFTSGRGCSGGTADIYIRLGNGRGQFSAGANIAGAVIPSNISRSGDWGAMIQMPLQFADGYQATPSAPSFFLGKATGNSLVSFWYNTPASTAYVPTATAISQAYSFAGSANMVLSQTKWNGAASFANNPDVAFDVSADNGLHWENMTAAELSGTSWHTFRNFGNQLRWRATLQSPNSLMVGTNAFYEPATLTPIKLKQVSLAVVAGGPSNFSRSRVLNTSALSPIGYSDVTITASFDFPGWQGHVVGASSAGIATGDANNLQAFAPRALLDAAQGVPSETARTIYTSIPSATSSLGSMTTTTSQRLPFTPAQAQSTATNPTLFAAMNLSPARAAAVASFVRRGGAPSGSAPILRDAGHSSPVIVAPPAEDPQLMGPNYANFAAAMAKRPPTILLGGNDGMLHAFAGFTGAELFGYIPFNLLGKLTSEVVVQADGSLGYQHASFVDGPITVADVYDGTSWHTVALVGQGDGSSETLANYYFALDVTDPTTATPLWEFGEGPSVPDRLCDPDPCTFGICYSTTSFSNGVSENQTNLGEMDLSGTALTILGQPAGLLQAEDFDYERPSAQAPGADFVVVKSGSSAMLSSASGGAYIQAQTSGGDCPAASADQIRACSSVSYRLNVPSTATAGTYYPSFSVWHTGGASQLSYALDNNILFSGQPALQNTAPNAWQWAKGPAMALSPGEHTLTVYMKTAGLSLDRLVLSKYAGPIGGVALETPATLYQTNEVNLGCQPVCLSNPDGQEWSICGAGQNLKCCPGNDPLLGVCTPVPQSCSQPNSQLGQSYSPPAVGRIRSTSGDAWVALFASGYNNLPAATNVGRSVYMVDALSGRPMASWNMPNVAPSASNPNIAPTMPGGVALVDADGDGYVDRLYVGDLAGRVFKVNLAATMSLDGQSRLTNQNAFPACAVFDAAVQGGARQWAPILTTPAVLVAQGTTPNIYFGTGGDLTAPDSVAYSFYSVRDSDPMNGCMATPRTAAALSANLLEWQVTEPAGSGRFWTDATVVNNVAVYFSSYVGSPDGILPCVSATQSSHLFGRATQGFTDTTGSSYQAGASVLFNRVNYLSTMSIIRTAPSIRGAAAVTSQVTRPSRVVSATAKDLLFQQLSGGTLRLSTPGVSGGRPQKMRHTGLREVQNF